MCRPVPRFGPARRPVRSFYRQPGFTLVELVVACVVFAVGVLGLQAAILVVLRQAHDARTQSLATELAAAQFERLAASQCTIASTGADQVRGVRSEWQTGPALGSDAMLVTQVLSFGRSGREQRNTYIGAVRCR